MKLVERSTAFVNQMLPLCTAHVRAGCSLPKDVLFFCNGWHTEISLCSLTVWSRCFRFVYYREFRSYWDGPQDLQAREMMQPVRLCVGGEWHRYPSSFYIPNEKIEVNFLRSDFHGQLPQPFAVSSCACSLLYFRLW